MATSRLFGFAFLIALAVLFSAAGPSRADESRAEQWKIARPPLVRPATSPAVPRPNPPLQRQGSEALQHRLAKASSAYTEHCGACHFPYPPDLLPSGSWKRILGKLDDHFGQVVDLPPPVAELILRYLEAGAADRSDSKRASKIMKSLGNETPLRITEVPYIQHKHRKISDSVLKRPSIGSLSNCIACHHQAAKGVFSKALVCFPE